jgi:hypothetical protein
MASIFTPVNTGLVLICVGLAVGIISKWNRKVRPPGPPGYPIIGNVFDMPSAHECYTFAEWRSTYGKNNFHSTIICRLMNARITIRRSNLVELRWYIHHHPELLREGCRVARDQILHLL